MRTSQLMLLSSVIFLTGSFLTNHLADSFALLFLSLLWGGLSLILMNVENKLDYYERKNKRLRNSIVIDSLIGIVDILIKLTEQKNGKRKSK